MSSDTSESRYARGLAKLAEVQGPTGIDGIEPLGEIGRYIVEFSFSDIYSRPGLSLRDREMVAVAALAVLSGREPQLKSHIKAALLQGITAKELEEVIIEMIIFGGFPTAINALTTLREIVGQPDPS